MSLKQNPTFTSSLSYRLLHADHVKARLSTDNLVRPGINGNSMTNSILVASDWMEQFP